MCDTLHISAKRMCVFAYLLPEMFMYIQLRAERSSVDLIKMHTDLSIYINRVFDRIFLENAAGDLRESD